MSPDSPAEQTIQNTPAQTQSDPFHIIDRYFSKQYLKNRPNQYHRSKIYTPTAGDNPMLSASYPLFTILHRIQQNASQNKHLMIDPADWQHELHAFMDALRIADYSREMIGSACFALMLMIDDTIQSLRRAQNMPAKLLPEALQDIQTSQLFFNLVDACYRDEKRYGHLLELLYYCLENGYTGAYAQKSQGLYELTQLRHQIMKTLKQHGTYEHPWLATECTPKRSQAHWPRLLPTLACCVLLLFGQGGYWLWQHHKISHAHPSTIARTGI